MNDLKHKKILLGVCGGIAAYKSLYLVRELIRHGAKVRVVMTRSAEQFVTPMSFQALTNEPVRRDVFDEQAERAMGHIELARWADYLLIAPLTANTMAKLAHGIADDLLTTLYLVAETPVLLCPAMNHSMWHHAATRHNCDVLKSRGAIVIGPDEGEQACGEYGLGRISEVDDIISALMLYSVSGLLKDKKVCITAGPTMEAIDPVRYISNHSSGKMGYALAKAAHMAGAEVTLISGPTHLVPPTGVTCVFVKTAKEMMNAVEQVLTLDTIFIGAAAVADYHVKNISPRKLKKGKDHLETIHLCPNPDIIAQVAQTRGAAYVVGFAAETEQVVPYALLKLEKKSLDMIIANQVGDDLGFQKDDNQVVVITKKEQIEIKLSNKTHLSGQIIAIIAANLQNIAS